PRPAGPGGGRAGREGEGGRGGLALVARAQELDDRDQSELADPTLALLRSRAPRNSTTAAWWPAAASARAFATTGDASSRRWSRVWSLDIGMLSPAYQLTAHSINASATAYSQKCGNAYMNDFSSSDWLA